MKTILRFACVLQFTAPLLGLSLTPVFAETNSLRLPPIATGQFQPNWNSLTNYQTPEWFRDAKFGIHDRKAQSDYKSAPDRHMSSRQRAQDDANASDLR